jgi:hypothetical protein
MLSTYLNALIATGFVLEHMREPAAIGKRAEQVPGEREVPSLLFLRACTVEDAREVQKRISTGGELAGTFYD